MILEKKKGGGGKGPSILPRRGEASSSMGIQGTSGEVTSSKKERKRYEYIRRGGERTLSEGLFLQRKGEEKGTREILYFSVRRGEDLN